MFNVHEPLGIIAGNGIFPRLVAEQAAKLGCRTIIGIAHKQETSELFPATVTKCSWIHVGQLGAVLKNLKRHAVHQVVLAGGISRNQLFKKFRPDATGLLFLGKLKFKGDDTLLKALVGFFGAHGITVLDGAALLQDCLTPKGLVAGRPLTTGETVDVDIGVKAAKILGQADIGQTVVVHNGTVVAVEALEGTDATIERAGRLTGLKDSRPSHDGLVLIKCAKPAQELRIDRPTIGCETIRSLAAAGGTVVAVEANTTLILEPQKVAELCNSLSVTVVGI